MISPFAARIKYSVPTFLPLEMKLADFEKNASVPFAVAVEGEGFRKVYDWKICGDDKNRNADIFFTDKILQFMLWAFGGKKVYLCGNNTARDIAEKYAPGHEHAFDASFMETIYRKKISFEFLPYNEKPDEFSSPSPVGGCTEGSRIGLDLGGTSIKSVLLLNGVTAISEITEWDPIANPDPSYHYARISSALKSIAEKAGKIDALGISTAGIVSDGRILFSSLFRSVPDDMYHTHVRNFFGRIAYDLGGNVPLSVINDGDASALSGWKANAGRSVLGLSLGTCLAAGYTDKNGKISGYLNELAFVPADASSSAPEDEWSGIKGAACCYLSRQALRFRSDAANSVPAPAHYEADRRQFEKTSAETDASESFFDVTGNRLAHSVALFSRFYDIDTVLIQGGLLSGKNGETVLGSCKKTLAACYPDLKAEIILPDEKSRRFGQAVAAACLNPFPTKN